MRALLDVVARLPLRLPVASRVSGQRHFHSRRRSPARLALISPFTSFHLLLSTNIPSALSSFQNCPLPFIRRLFTRRIVLSITPLPSGDPRRQILTHQPRPLPSCQRPRGLATVLFAAPQPQRPTLLIMQLVRGSVRKRCGISVMIGSPPLDSACLRLPMWMSTMPTFLARGSNRDASPVPSSARHTTFANALEFTSP
jgi:hypothetical protein